MLVTERLVHCRNGHCPEQALATAGIAAHVYGSGCTTDVLSLLIKAAADQIVHLKALREAAVVFQQTFADPDLAAAIATGGIDDGPTPTAPGPAA